MIKALVNDYYDIQHFRIEVEGQLRAEAQGVSEQMEVFTKEKVLGRLKDIEKDIYKELNRWVNNEPIYTEWLKNVKGIGPILTAGLISWIGNIEPHQKKVIPKFGENKGKEIIVDKGFVTISKLWAYAGLHVTDKGRAVKRAKGQKSNWNSRLKTHCWKIGESFIKTKGGYRKLYDQFRAEYDKKWVTGDDCGSDVCKKNKNKCYDMHKFMAAKRKTVKVFLAHYFMKSRELKGLPIDHPFILGREHHSHLIEVIEE